MIPQSLLDTIIADPLSDTPRLITADYLEELNTPESRDRSEFIRVQCALAQLGPARKVYRIVDTFSPPRFQRMAWETNVFNGACYVEGDPVAVGDRIDLLLTKEHARGYKTEWYGVLVVRTVQLPGDTRYRGIRTEVEFRVDEHSRPWAGEPLKRREKELMTPYNLSLWSLGIDVVTDLGVFRRGFVDEVHGTQDWWLRHGPRLVRHFPLTVVRLTDKQPSPLTHAWERHGNGLNAEWRIDPILYHTLRQLGQGKEHAVSLPNPDNPSYLATSYWWRFHDDNEATKALSMACLLWAKGKGSLTTERRTMTMSP